MTTTRRNLLRCAGAFAAFSVARGASAQAYPARPVRWIVPFPPGGPSDILARLIGQSLSERFGQPFVIENRPGASGNIGTQVAASATGDGHTLLLVAAPNAINAALYPNLGFDFVRDIAPVASIARGALIVLFRPRPLCSSSLMRKPALAGSTWRQPETVRPRMSPASCSRS